MALEISVLAGGRAPRAIETKIAREYLQRASEFGRSTGFQGFTLKEFDDRATGKLSALLKAADYPVLLEERGTAETSAEFARHLCVLRDQGRRGVTFVIGGADGFDAASRAFAKETISLGPQTWPHLLVRAMICEQIFRAMTIIAKHPYHREGGAISNSRTGKV
jgi:23S rRNA (pseudouridine1915-N3)-methyltransferase